MAKAEKPGTPNDLSASGGSLWRNVTGKYDLRFDELRVLEDACREADLVDDLASEARDAPRIVHGAQGQPVINPLISELRHHRSTLSSLLRQLKLPDDASSSAASAPRSTQARNAATNRWHKQA